MNNIQTYDFQGNQIRSLVKEDDTIWFCYHDVCNILGLTNGRQFLPNLYENEKGVHKTYTLGGNQDLTFISESGLYKLIFKSKKPEAVKFQDWVTQEVLPTIRKDGGYINPNDYRDPWKIMENMMIQARRMQDKIEELTPKAQMLESFFEGINDNISFNTFAKLSKFITIDGEKPVGGKMLKDKCIEEGLVGKKDRLPNQFYINKGYFKVFYPTAVNGTVYPTGKITPKGQRWLFNRMLKFFNRAA